MWVSTKSVGPFLDRLHYLGAVSRGFCWSDEHGVLVLAKPTSRRLPQDGTWLELIRWCLLGEKNAGSRQWAKVSKALRVELPQVTTVVSYSDPSQGHTGALYKDLQLALEADMASAAPPPIRERIVEGRQAAVGEGPLGVPAEAGRAPRCAVVREGREHRAAHGG